MDPTPSLRSVGLPRLPGVKADKRVAAAIARASDPLPAWVTSSEVRYGDAGAAAATKTRAPAPRVVPPIAPLPAVASSTAAAAAASMDAAPITSAAAAATARTATREMPASPSRGGRTEEAAAFLRSARSAVVLDMMRDEWMGFQGRLRMGADGVPLKFSLTQAAVVSRRSTSGAPAAPTDASQRLPPSAVAAVHRFSLAAARAAAPPPPPADRVMWVTGHAPPPSADAAALDEQGSEAPPAATVPRKPLTSGMRQAVDMLAALVGVPALRSLLQAYVCWLIHVAL